MYLKGAAAPFFFTRQMDTRLIRYLEGFVTERRLALFDRVLQNRTRYITVALEDIFQPQNASAVLRSCDCFGIQNIHIIENSNEYQLNPDVTLGSDKWLTLTKYNTGKHNTTEALTQLREDGYRIIATSPHTEDFTPEDFPLEAGKFALFFGTELHGLSDEVIRQADAHLRIPMYGFTESFNISVSAAVSLHTLTGRLRMSDLSWRLSEEEMLTLKLQWLRSSIKKSELLEKDFYKKLANSQNITN